MGSGIDRAKSNANRALTSTHMIDSDYESAVVILNVVNHYPASIERGAAPVMVICKTGASVVNMNCDRHVHRRQHVRPCSCKSLFGLYYHQFPYYVHLPLPPAHRPNFQMLKSRMPSVDPIVYLLQCCTSQSSHNAQKCVSIHPHLFDSTN